MAATAPRARSWRCDVAGAQRPDAVVGLGVVGAEHQLGEVGGHLAALGQRAVEGEHVGGQDRLPGLHDLVDAGVERRRALLVRGGVLERVVVAVDADVLQDPGRRRGRPSYRRRCAGRRSRSRRRAAFSASRISTRRAQLRLATVARGPGRHPSRVATLVLRRVVRAGYRQGSAEIQSSHPGGESRPRGVRAPPRRRYPPRRWRWPARRRVEHASRSLMHCRTP